MNDPFLLLADEPTGTLDADAKDNVMQILRDIHRRGTAVIVATQDIELTHKYPQRTVLLYGGRVKEGPA